MSRSIFCLSLLVAVLSRISVPAEESLLFYASFDKGVDADRAAGNGRGIFHGHPARLDFTEHSKSQADPLLKFAPGIKGNGLVSGRNGQVVYYQAKGNIDPAVWTVTFWVKGNGGRSYLEEKRNHQELFEMFGGGWTRFYKYQNRGRLWLLIQKKGPRNEDITQKLFLKQKMDTSQWHFFALSYEKGSGVSIYVDGRLAQRDRGMVPSQKPAWFRFGQSFGGDNEPNRILDELRIYSGALSGEAVLRHYLREQGWRTRQYARALKSRAGIAIDGRLDDAGWAGAAVISGFIDTGSLTLAGTQTRAYVTYDDSSLYLAFQSEIPEEARNRPETRLLHGMLKQTKLQHDVNVDADDSFGAYIIPRYPEGNLYRLYVNGIETKYEYSISTEGEIRLKWDPRWEVKSRLSMSGWTVEARIPLRDLEIDRIRGGEQWKFQFFRNWRLLKKETDAWAVATGPKKERSDDFGTIVFAGNEGFAVRVDQFARRESDGVKIAGKISNPSRESVQLVARLKSGDEELGSRAISAGAGRVADFRFEDDLAQATSNVLHFTVTAEGGQPVYSQDIPYSAPDELELSLRKYPSKDLLAVTWRLRGLDAPPKALAALVEVLSESSDKPVLSHRIVPLPALNSTSRILTRAIPPGKYRVRMTLSRKGKLLVKKTVDYEKRPLPDWLGNQLGISEEVPPPWTPVQVEGDAVSVWGRRYDFGGKLLPVRIVNQGKRILAGPISLECRTKRDQVVNSAEAPAGIKWNRKSPTRAISTRVQQLGGLAITSKSTIEFDGMVWLEITARPKKARAVVNALILTIPMKKEYVRLINAYDYSLRTTGRLPEKGYVSAMGPRWIGDEEGGLQVFAETSANWIVENKRKELEITNGAEQAAFRLHLIDRPVELTGPVTFALGFMVTPVKKTNRRMRDILSISGRWIPVLKGTDFLGTHCKKAFEAHRGLEVFHLWSQGWWQTEPGFKGSPDRTGFYPVPRGTLRNSYGATKTEYGMVLHSAPYTRLQQAWAGSPEFAQFGDEWLSNASQPFIPSASVPRARWAAQVCQNARSFQDFTLYGLNRLMEKTEVKAFYFDVSKPHACNNTFHGCGLPSSEGPGAYTTNFLGARRLIQRIYTLLKQKHPGGLIFFHMSGQVIMPCWSFTDAMVDGENYASLLDRKNNRGYEKVLTLEQFAAEYAAQNNFGPYSLFLPEFERAGSVRRDEWKEVGYQHAEYLLGLIFLHNSQLWFPVYLAAEPAGRVYLAFDENGLDSSWSFIGYWKQKALALPPDIKASFYVSPDRKRAFMLVMNVGEKDRILDLAPRPGELNMATSSLVRLLYPAGGGEVIRGPIKAAIIPAKNFRLYLLQ